MRLSIPLKLSSIVGKRGLLEPPGADRAQAIRKLAISLARIPATLDAARNVMDQPCPARRLSTDEAARTHYGAELAIDERSRDAPAKISADDFDALFLPGYQAALTRSPRARP